MTETTNSETTLADLRRIASENHRDIRTILEERTPNAAATIRGYVLAAFEAALGLWRSARQDEAIRISDCLLLHALRKDITQLAEWIKLWEATRGTYFQRAAASALHAALRFAIDVDDAMAGLDEIDGNAEITPSLDQSIADWTIRAVDNAVKVKPRHMPLDEIDGQRDLLIEQITVEYMNLKQGAQENDEDDIDIEPTVGNIQGMRWQEARDEAEAHVRRYGFPGVKPLARAIGCSDATMRKAIDGQGPKRLPGKGRRHTEEIKPSKYLQTERRKANRRKQKASPTAESLGGMHLDNISNVDVRDPSEEAEVRVRVKEPRAELIAIIVRHMRMQDRNIDEAELRSRLKASDKETLARTCLLIEQEVDECRQDSPGKRCTA